MISSTDIGVALKDAGVVEGGVVFCHSNLAFFGQVKNCSNSNELADIFLSAFMDVLGPTGALIVPAFTYSFGSEKFEKVFDPSLPAKGMSTIANRLIERGVGIRSLDPMLSVVGFGEKAYRIVKNVGNICYGPNSIWERLFEEDALICNLNFDSGSTFLHWVEREIGVTYRTDFELSGTILINEENIEKKMVYTGRHLDDMSATPSFQSFHTMCLREGITKKINLGRGQICSHSCGDVSRFLKKTIKVFPFILTQGNRYSID